MFGSVVNLTGVLSLKSLVTQMAQVIICPGVPSNDVSLHVFLCTVSIARFPTESAHPAIPRDFLEITGRIRPVRLHTCKGGGERVLPIITKTSLQLLLLCLVIFIHGPKIFCGQLHAMLVSVVMLARGMSCLLYTSPSPRD